MTDNLIEAVAYQSDWIRNYLYETLAESPLWLISSIDFSVRVMILGALSALFYFVTVKIILHTIVYFIEKSESKKDDFFVKRKVFHRLAHIAPAIIIYALANHLFELYPFFNRILNNGSEIYMILILFWTIQAALYALEDIYNTLNYARENPIRNYMQLIHLLSYFVGFLVIIGFVYDIQVTRIFAGMGAMAAVLMLVFKDTILGFVAGIQLSANKMVRVGDWIAMPSHNADGDVIEITLNTVKVQNWDRTITTIPTYALVSSPFINWRGMEESGGRRIKRAINLDMRSVKFCSDEMLQKFSLIHHLKDYIKERLLEIKAYNEQHQIDGTVKVNGRRMTNLGVFRKYLENYICSHPKLNTDMIYLIRHLEPSEKGIPLEIYVFCRDKAWANFEAIQADIFDHVLAVIPEFELRVFQLPTGDDLQEGINRLALQNKG